MANNLLLSSFLRKTANANETSGKYPFLPAGNHRDLVVKNFFVLAGGTNGNTLILEVLVAASDNPAAEGKVHSVVCGLDGKNSEVGYGNLKAMQRAMIGSINGKEITEPISEEDMAEVGLLGVKIGPKEKGEDVPSQAIGIHIASNSVQVLKRGEQLPMNDKNSYVRHNWQPVFQK